MMAITLIAQNAADSVGMDSDTHTKTGSENVNWFL
jgi:hypothetical protein